MPDSSRPDVDELQRLFQGRSEEGRGDDPADAGVFKGQSPQGAARKAFAVHQDGVPALTNQDAVGDGARRSLGQAAASCKKGRKRRVVCVKLGLDPIEQVEQEAYNYWANHQSLQL